MYLDGPERLDWFGEEREFHLISSHLAAASACTS